MADIRTVFEGEFKKEKLLFDEPMKNHTSFKIGGNADVMLLPESVEDIERALKLCKENAVECFIMGNGSNLLVSDKGIRGAVIKIAKGFSKITVDKNRIKAQSGALLSRLANEVLKCSLTGFEFASGIPGTLGGAVCMNAGAYGGEVKDIIKSVTVIDNGQIKTLSAEECGFEYRNSRILKEKMIVLEAEMELKEGIYEEILARMKELNAQRKEKQPLELPSAGSTFKRPEGYFAGKLIMDAGLRGFCVGGAQVSEKHCGFVVNKGGATCEDVLKLIEEVKKTVFEKFGVMLEEEVRKIGE